MAYRDAHSTVTRLPASNRIREQNEAANLIKIQFGKNAFLHTNATNL